ncbi:hypothetical protein AC1031_011622 [Aphanomyces cochlioides]|nr:hypothetical protein AC1031_011622 [Aphanomyces cochlioides]
MSSTDAEVPLVEKGVDDNGIKTGDWAAPIFGCADTLIPNAFMSFICPCVTMSQILTRLGFAKYVTGLVATFGVTIFFIIASIIEATWLNVLAAIAAIVLVGFKWYLRFKVRTLFGIPGTFLDDGACSVFCSCCSLAQIATHVESYTPGACSFDAKATLPGYRL